MKFIKRVIRGVFRRFLGIFKRTPMYKRYIKNQQQKTPFAYDLRFFMRRHRAIFGYTTDFSTPKSFNEKIIHRILFDRKPIYSALADKLKARIYIQYMLRDFAAESKNLDSSAAHKRNSQIIGGGGVIAKI